MKILFCHTCREPLVQNAKAIALKVDPHGRPQMLVCIWCYYEHQSAQMCPFSAGLILADTETWSIPLCPACYEAIGEPRREPQLFRRVTRLLQKLAK